MRTRKRNNRLAQLASLAIGMLLRVPAHGIVTPADDRAFGTNAAGRGILTQMVDEVDTPALARPSALAKGFLWIDFKGGEPSAAFRSELVHPAR